MIQELMTISGVEGIALDTADEAFEQRDALLSRASVLGNVQTMEEAQSFAVVIKDLKAFSNLIEEARKAIKVPLLDRCRQIDQLAANLTQQIELESGRLGAAISVFQNEQRRQAEEARRKAWEEEQRIKREAAERERAAQAEAAKLQAQADSKTAEKLRQKAEAEAKAREERLARDIAATRESAVATVAPKLDGISGRKKYAYEVTDLVALYEAMPALVKLSPNDAAIKGHLKQLRPDQTLPGLKWWIEHGVAVRI